jgi:hypothetical protein
VVHGRDGSLSQLKITVTTLLVTPPPAGLRHLPLLMLRRKTPNATDDGVAVEAEATGAARNFPATRTPAVYAEPGARARTSKLLYRVEHSE